MNNILQEIEKYKYISFDVFDTLILRNVLTPHDIFKYIEQQVLRQFGPHYKGFAEKRINAEKKARATSQFDEIELKEIYEVLVDEFPKTELEIIYNEELKIELLFSTPNIDAKKIFRQCKELNKKIIITTDIYLPREFMKILLDTNGFNGWDYLYVSSNDRATKRKGTLYKKILNDLNIQPNELVHIGDNINSDVKSAKKIGIHGILFSTPKKINYSIDVKDKLFDSTAEAFIRNTLPSISNEQKLGFECFGPLLYGMSLWILEQVKAENINHVFFLSRDGYIMQKAFNILCNNTDVVDTYFYASRRALRVPLLAYSPTYELFVKTNYWPQHVTLRDFIKAMGIENLDNSYIQKLDLKYTINRDNITNDKIFFDTYNNLIGDVSRSATKELEALLAYCQQEKLIGKVAIVDIGWHGNMQLNLKNILDANGRSVDVKGFYVGISPIQNHKLEQDMRGYVFDIDKNMDLFKKEREVNGIFEEIFMAPHGSLKKYELDDDGLARPVLYPLEQQDEKSISILTAFQRGGLRFVKDFSKFKKYVHISDRFAIGNILQFLLYPTLEDALLWSDIVFKDVDEKPIVKYRNRKFYLTHPSAFLVDYKASIWKEGFLKIVFKNNYDYYRWSQLIIKIRYWTHYKFHKK